MVASLWSVRGRGKTLVREGFGSTHSPNARHHADRAAHARSRRSRLRPPTAPKAGTAVAAVGIDAPRRRDTSDLGTRPRRRRRHSTTAAHALDRRRAHPEAVLSDTGSAIAARGDPLADRTARAHRANDGHHQPG